jgi:hypothetical protein
LPYVFLKIRSAKVKGFAGFAKDDSNEFLQHELKLAKFSVLRYFPAFFVAGLEKILISEYVRARSREARPGLMGVHNKKVLANVISSGFL